MENGNKNIPSKIVEIWQQIVDSLAELISVRSVMINRLEPPELEVFRSSHNPDNPFHSGIQTDMANVYCETTARQRDKLLIEDANKDPKWANHPAAKIGMISYIGFPLLWPNGDVFGTICAFDTKENKWKKHHENLFQSFRNAIEAHLALVETLESLDKKNRELELTLSEVKTLRGLLPICSSCKNVRDDKGYWSQIERYIQQRSDVEFTHGLCPKCAEKLYGFKDDSPNQ